MHSPGFACQDTHGKSQRAEESPRSLSPLTSLEATMVLMSAVLNEQRSAICVPPVQVEVWVDAESFAGVCGCVCHSGSGVCSFGGEGL